MKRELLIATSNQNKFLEILSGLRGEPFEILSLRDFSEVPEAVEEGSDFREIARNKAIHYSRRTGKPVIAEDSGLVIPSLHDFPGIYSARIASNEQSRIEMVLSKLKGFAGDNRLAYYVCCMTFMHEAHIYETEGRCNGRIAEEPAGTVGFGYDPIFYPEGIDRTFGMMDLSEKMSYSHRGRALQKMIPFLRSQFL